MQVVKFIEENKVEKTVVLKNVKQGEIIRFPSVSFEEALNENLFYYVLSNKDKRVKLLCLSNAELIERDEDWHVVEHKSKLIVSPAILETVKQ